MSTSPQEIRDLIEKAAQRGAKVRVEYCSHALVLMDDGTTRTCHGMNRGPGIGWHAI